MTENGREAIGAPDHRSSPVTIHDVARASNVSIGTASKALNGRGNLRAETRDRVRAAADRLGYWPNDLAHSLRRGRSCTVGLLTSDLKGRFSMPLLAGIESAMSKAQISVFLCNAGGDPARESQYLDALRAKRIDGLIVAGTRSDPRPPVAVGKSSIPVLYAFATTTDPSSLCIVPDNHQGGELAAAHLVKAGRRRFAHITGPEAFEGTRARLAGMRQVLSHHGITCPASLVAHGRWTEAWGYEAASHLLDKHRSIDAIACGSDVLARGAIDALREQGVRVPDDVAVTGFDNWKIIAASTRPPLTTIDMQLERLGSVAGDYLLRLIDGEVHTGVLRMPTQLVCRSSCGGANCAPVVDSEDDLAHW